MLGGYDCNARSEGPFALRLKTAGGSPTGFFSMLYDIAENFEYKPLGENLPDFFRGGFGDAGVRY